MDLVKLLSNIDPATLIAIVTAYISLRERLVRIETKLGIAEKDIDGLGAFVGTPKAKSRTKGNCENSKLEEKNEKDS